MKTKLIALLILFTGTFFVGNAQPFIDVLNLNAQVFNGKSKDSLHTKKLITDYTLNVFIPKQIGRGHTLLFRFMGEMLESGNHAPYSDLYAISTSAGFQYLGKSRRWKAGLILTYKASSDLKGQEADHFQYGGTALFTYVSKDSLLKLKAGLYYNRECFGNFFVPIVGIDWKANRRISIYGILPNNLRVEYKVCDKFYTGIGYKNYQRSYRLSYDYSGGDDFIRVKESQVKLFFDFTVYKKFILFADAAYMLKYSLIQYDGKNVNEEHFSTAYGPMENNFLFTVGVAYRVRID